MPVSTECAAALLSFWYPSISCNLNKRAKPWRILVVVVKWRHRANGLFAAIQTSQHKCLKEKSNGISSHFHLIVIMLLLRKWSCLLGEMDKFKEQSKDILNSILKEEPSGSYFKALIEELGADEVLLLK